MKTNYYNVMIILILSLSTCNGDLGKLSGLLVGAHQQIHNRVHGVADAVLGGLNFNVHGHIGHQRQPVQQPAKQGETIFVIVEESNGGDQGSQSHRPYGPPQQGQYRPPHRFNPNEGYIPNNGYNHNHGQQNNGLNNNQGYNQNTGYKPNHGYNPSPNPPNYGQGQYENQQINGNNYNNGNSGHQMNKPSYPNQHEQYNNGQDNYQNGQNNNVNPHQNGNTNYVIKNPDPNVNNIKNPEQNNPNGNIKPTETYNGNYNDDHKAENAHQGNDKVTKKPDNDGPLLVPLNDYTYEGDKIVINAPKRETDNNKKNEDSDEEFPIDIRFKDE